jgi:CRP/FNR family cyclic AMP-dependent transcriptional regulator
MYSVLIKFALQNIMEAKDKLWYLEHFDLLQRLKKDDIINMEKNMVMRTVNKDTMLHFPEMKGRHVYFLKEGMVKISTIDEDGKELLKYIIRPGYIFGEMALLDGNEDENDFAVAMENCVVCFMDVENLKGMMQMNAELNTRIRKLIGLRIKRIENRLSAMVFKDAATRIYDFLNEFAREHGTEEANGYNSKLFLTHDDIAKLTATTRQTVSTTMNKLREQGKISYDQKYLKVFKTPIRIEK